MTLYRRPSGTYDIYIWMGGIRYRKPTYTKNRRQAELIENKFRDELNLMRHGIVQAEPDLTLGTLAARFIAADAATAYHLGRLEVLLPFWADTPVLRITKGLAQEYRLWRHKQNPMLSDATINRDLSVLRHLLYWAVDNSLLAANPLTRMRLKPERRTKKRILSVAEEVGLLATCAKHFRPIVLMALDTGMRRGELLQQLWQDVDFDRRVLSVTRSKTPQGESREIPLTGRVYQFLEEHRLPEGVIFTFNEKPIRLVKTAWKKALERSQVHRLRFHDLRHTFNTRLLEAGVIQDVRKALMGHSSNDVHGAYSHVELPTKREAIRKLEAWLNGEYEKLNHPEPGNTEGAQSAHEHHPDIRTDATHVHAELPMKLEANRKFEARTDPQRRLSAEMENTNE